jgi:hypothetical protein
MLERFTKQDKDTTSTESSDEIQGTIASSLELVPIEYINGAMMVMSDGSFRAILRCNSVNLDLMNAEEQMDRIQAFGQLLLSLTPDFPLQVIAHSEHMDTRRYTARYERRLKDPSLTPEIRSVIEAHIRHYEQQARDFFLLDRSVLVVVPYYLPGRIPSTAQRGLASDLPGGGLLKALDSSYSNSKHTPSDADVLSARIQMETRVGAVAGQLQRIGVSCELLQELDIVRLLREFYNPGVSEIQSLQSYSAGEDFIDIRIDVGDDGLRTRGAG